MNLYIELDHFGRGIVYWVFNASNGIGPYLPSGDPFGLQKIDRKATKRLREFLELATEGNLRAYGLEAHDLARAISFCLARIKATLPDALPDEPVIKVPKAFSESLGLPDAPLDVSEWLKRYPIENANGA